MEGGRVSVEGRSVEVAHPFFVLATRNPIEFHGTYPMPEAALDRFLMRVTVHYPDPEGELRLYLGSDPEAALARLEPVLSREALLGLLDRVGAVAVSEPLAAYCYSVVSATREHEAVALGVSPRAAMAWLRAGRARACLHGRDYVLPDDLKALAVPTLAHRIALKGGGDSGPLLRELIHAIPVKL
jgi:MoxR-like ATPase